MAVASTAFRIGTDRLTIRGRELDLGELVDPALDRPEVRAGLREQLLAAAPFPHLVADYWFNSDLLDLVHEEFDAFADANWRIVKGKHELTYRSLPGSALGPASQVYFNLINSAWFVELLRSVMNLDHLIPDPMLYGGGLHECRRGGSFDVHRDFNRHVRYGLNNEAVLITYLNRQWNPNWGGALELWDGARKAKVTEVHPLFGRTLLMPHGPNSYHGHPDPLDCPEHRARRSVAAYYYSNRDHAQQVSERHPSLFLFLGRRETFRRILHLTTPPVVRAAARWAKQKVKRKLLGR